MSNDSDSGLTADPGRFLGEDKPVPNGLANWSDAGQLDFFELRFDRDELVRYIAACAGADPDAVEVGAANRITKRGLARLAVALATDPARSGPRHPQVRGLDDE